jgi:PAS domain S-box-containing protein
MALDNVDVVSTDALRGKLAELEHEILRLKQAQQSGDRRFLALADAAPMMIWMTGPEALPTYFNRAWLDFRGRTLEEEVGDGWTEGLHSEDRALRLETFLTAVQSRQPFRIQYRLRRANGDYALVEDAGVPRLGGDGEFAGYVGSVTEAPSRRRTVFAPDEQAVRLVFSLTERERQVLVLIAQGKSTKEAAARLGISYKTADSHRSRILEKLGVHETASMVRYAIRAGLIEP